MSTSPYSIFETWSRASVRALEGAVAVNRTALSAFSSNGDRTDDRIEPAVDLPEWEIESDVSDELSVGDTLRFTKMISEADVDRFATASGDTNPLHLDEEVADESRFEGRIVHGVLAAGLISAALARLPGHVVYLSQDLEFRAPVRLGDRVTAEIEIAEALGDGRYRLRTTVSKDEELVIDGEAVVLVDD